MAMTENRRPDRHLSNEGKRFFLHFYATLQILFMIGSNILVNFIKKQGWIHNQQMRLPLRWERAVQGADCLFRGSHNVLMTLNSIFKRFLQTWHEWTDLRTDGRTHIPSFAMMHLKNEQKSNKQSMVEWLKRSL